LSDTKLLASLSGVNNMMMWQRLATPCYRQVIVLQTLACKGKVYQHIAEFSVVAASF
jgi:hypothetical protein